MLVSARSDLPCLLPHAGRMLLLDHVRYWDTDVAECVALSHRDPLNPLRRHGLLPAICGLEYAAQAMAAHCGLLAIDPAKPSRGYLGAVCDINLQAERLDDTGDDLLVVVSRQLTEPMAAIYAFELIVDKRVLVAGRASVFLQWQVQP